MTTYTRPSYNELKARIEADLADLPAVLRTGFCSALAKSHHGEHGHLDWLDDQCSPLTCELERLADWAVLYKVERLAATAATGNVLATGTVGSEILAGVVLRGTNGLDYTVTAAIDLTSDATTSVSVVCSSAGSDGNLTAGQTLTLVDPISGVSSTLTVDDDGLTGGDEEEDVDDWRARVVDEWQTVTTDGARAGKKADYIYWAKSAHPSVSAALVQFHTLGTGTVIVRPICNGLDQRLPTAAVLAAVEEALDSLAPATADWRVVAPIVRTVSFEISLSGTADTSANRTAISSALSELLLTETTEEASLDLAEINAAIATVTTSYELLAPTASTSALAGEVLVFGGVSW